MSYILFVIIRRKKKEVSVSDETTGSPMDDDSKIRIIFFSNNFKIEKSNVDINNL